MEKFENKKLDKSKNKIRKKLKKKVGKGRQKVEKTWGKVEEQKIGGKLENKNGKSWTILKKKVGNPHPNPHHHHHDDDDDDDKNPTLLPTTGR